MREIRTSGLMSGVWETGRRFASAPAPDLDSTDTFKFRNILNQASRKSRRGTHECGRYAGLFSDQIEDRCRERTQERRAAGGQVVGSHVVLSHVRLDAYSVVKRYRGESVSGNRIEPLDQPFRDTRTSLRVSRYLAVPHHVAATAVGSRAEDGCPVVVLQRHGKQFNGRQGEVIGQHQNRLRVREKAT